jgi:hypothetical protein
LKNVSTHILGTLEAFEFAMFKSKLEDCIKGAVVSHFSLLNPKFDPEYVFNTLKVSSLKLFGETAAT